MKKEKRQRQNPSSKVLVGLAAVGVAGNASGAIVQIDLIGNRITAGGGNAFNADLTGDGMGDVAFGTAVYISEPLNRVYYVTVGVGGVAAFAVSRSPSSFFIAGVGGGTPNGDRGGSVSGVIPILFDASSLGGGSLVTGLLAVTAGGVGDSRGVTLDSVFFDDAGATLDAATDTSAAILIGSTQNGVFTPVPEPSSLALLALGAGGLLTRRQRKRAGGGEG